MNYPSCFLSSKLLGDDVMVCLSHQRVVSAWMLGFLPYHEKWGEELYNALWSLYLWTYADVSYAKHHFCMFITVKNAYSYHILNALLCLSIFPLIHDAPPPVFSMYILNSSTSKLVTSVEFSNAPSSSILTPFHACC